MRFSTRASIVCPGGMAEASVWPWCVALFGMVAAVLGTVAVGGAALGIGVAAGGALVAGAGGVPVVCAHAGATASSSNT